MNPFLTLLVQPLANGLIVFYKLFFSNLGLAIIGFSIFLRLILLPLTKPYMESMKKMKKIQPKLDKLKKKYNNDTVKLAQAQSDLYKNNEIKPGAGCLPYLLQIAILIAFFNVFTRILNTDNPTEAVNNLLYPVLKLAEGDVLNTKFLYLDLAKPNMGDNSVFSFLSFDVPGLLLIFAAIVQVISAKITSPYEEVEKRKAKETPGKSDDFQASMQKSMILTFPLFTLFFGMKLPSALALYWVIFSLFQAVQQYKSSGWGGMTPWLRKLGLIELKKPDKK